jgi:hypothetical protein
VTIVDEEDEENAKKKKRVRNMYGRDILEAWRVHSF